MNNSTLHNHKTSPQKPHKHTTKRLTEDQVKLLESCFDSGKKLEPERKHQLSRQLGVPPRQIAIWYQNKRARWKTQRLEHDYNMLQLQLEATLVETKNLEKEIENLRAELNKLQAEQERHHKYYNNNRAPIDYSISVCGEEVGSSSRTLEDDIVNNLYCSNEQVLFEVEENMYAAAACLITSDLGLFGSKIDLF